MKNEYGYITTYDPLKGFGFIRREKGKDVFFHYSDLKTPEEHIGEGDKVSFTIQKDQKKLRANEVTKIS